MSDGRHWKPVNSKKTTISWLVTGSKVTKLQVASQKKNAAAAERNNTFPLNEINQNQKSPDDKESYGFQTTDTAAFLPNLNLNMISTSSVLVLVQDNNIALNLPNGGGLAPLNNRLVPPIPNTGSKYDVNREFVKTHFFWKGYICTLKSLKQLIFLYLQIKMP